MRPSDQQELYRVRFVSNDDRRSDISGNSSSASTLIKDSITGSTKSGTSQLRKFTAGIGRPGQAREAREAVRNVISAQSSSRRVVAAEPLDYEKFVIEKAVLLENDPQRELLMFPRDDVEEVVEPKESSTVVPMVHPQDAEGLSWLLPRDFVNDIYSPKRSISFNYAKFGGDYDSVLDEPPETEEMSSSLVFESDMIAEEERVAAENAPTTDVIKEGFVIVLSDTGLLDNFKPGKRRYCTVKQLISGEVAVDIRKSRDTPPKRPQLIVGSAQLRSRRRGRTAIEIEPARSSQEKSEARSLTLAFDDSEDLSNWFLSIQRALSFGAKGDTLSLGSFQPDDSYGRTNEPDSSSIGSADSGRESLLWRGQRAVAKALQPPIVDRKNIFSLYSSLSPSTKPVCEPLSILSCGSSSKPVQEHAEVITVQFIIEFKKLDLKLDVGASSPVQIEPFYLTFFVYDIAQAARVSEEFRIVCNSDTGLGIEEEDRADDLSKIYGVSRAKLCTKSASQMIFTTHCSPKDLWLVCCVDRMLSLDYTGDLYMKSCGDAKAGAKLQKLIQSSYPRLSNYRQKFAWAARPLLEENLAREAANPNFNKGFSTMRMFRCDSNRLTDQDIQKYLSDFAKTEKTSKSIIPRGSVGVRIDVIGSIEDYKCRVNPSYFALKPWSLSDDSPVAPVFELQTFNDRVFQPHSDFVHHLYIYPMHLKYEGQRVFPKARNILCTVQLFCRADNIPTRAFYNRLDPTGPLTLSAKCAVQYHQQYPLFGDEIKLRLPINLSKGDHILFSFSHIAVGGQPNSKLSESVETPIGYAFLPLMFSAHTLMLDSDEQDISLPVAAELPAMSWRSGPHYDFNNIVDKSMDLVKWVDPRPLFRFRMRLVSSIFTSEVLTQATFHSCDLLNEGGLTATEVNDLKMTPSVIPTPASNEAVRSCSPLVADRPFDDENPVVDNLKCVLGELSGSVPVARLIPHLYLLLSRLLEVLTLFPPDKLAKMVFRALFTICDRVEEQGHKPLLRTFVRDHFVAKESAEGTTHAAICRYLPEVAVAVQGDSFDSAALFRQLWFFFDVMAKSIAQTIVRRSVLKCPRRARLPLDVMEQIGIVVANLVPLLISKHNAMPNECHTGITCIAYFLRCCLSFIDRGAVFKWMNFIIQQLEECDSKVARDYKLDVITIISQHEHWLPLCLPVVIDSQNQIHRVVNQPLSSEYSITSGSSSRFLPRFFTSQLSHSSTATADKHRYTTCSKEWYLNSTYISHHFPIGVLFRELYASMLEPREYRHRVISLVRNLLAKHSFDKRYLDMNIQRRIAVLYIPLIRFALDHCGEMEDVIADDLGEPSAFNNNASVSEAPASRSFGTCSTAFTQNSSSPNFAIGEKLDKEEVQDILVSVLYVIHRVPKRILGVLCMDMKKCSAMQLLNLLDLALNVFRYRGRPEPKPAAEKTAIAKSGARSSRDLASLQPSRPDAPFRALQLLNLSQEVALIVLEVCQSLAHEFMDRYGRSCEDGVVSKLFSIYLSILDDYWPESVRLHALAALSLFINTFHSYLFEDGPLDELSLLIEKLLVVVSSRLPAIQNAAAALLHIVLRSGYEASQAYLAGQAMAQSVLAGKSQSSAKTFVERLGRPGCQTSVALARLLGSRSTISGVRLEKGLHLLQTLSNVSDTKRTTSFGQAVTELVQQLRGVMLATVALKDAANDRIRLADLHLQLADSYRGSAALRSAWFEALAQIHTDGCWHAEAAVCHGHSLAIIAKELASKGQCKMDWSAFDWISSSIAKCEGTAEVDGNVQEAGFTLDSLASTMDQTARALTLAERYEAIGPMYRLIIPMFEKADSFKSLVGIYAELQQTYSRAAEVKASGKRHLGSYFRVRFFGEFHSKVDHGTDWIYREAGLSSLAEVSLKLREQHRQMIGHDRIQVEPGSEGVPATPDPAVAYIWVNHVDPVIPEGLTSKHFLTHTNLRKFTYESPVLETLTNEGEEPSLVNQALRKTVLEVDGVFPSARRRLPVLSVASTILSPIEFACQKLESKAKQINAVLDDVTDTRPLDVKGLQLLLQGAVLPTVNAGPLAYAEAFTQDEQKKRYGEDKLKDLESAFRKLMSSCERALQVNETVVAMDQQTYHEVLVASFDAMHERLMGFFGKSFREPREQDGNIVPKSAIHVLDTIGGVSI